MKSLTTWLIYNEPACKEGRLWVAGRQASRALWLECVRADWMLWVAAGAGVERRRVVLACSAVAWTALRFVPAGVEQPARAVDLARRYGLGEDISLEELQAAADASYGASYGAAAYAAASAADAAVTVTRATATATHAAYASALAGSSMNRREAHARYLAALAPVVRRVIGWPRVARALRAQGVEVVR